MNFIFPFLQNISLFINRFDIWPAGPPIQDPGCRAGPGGGARSPAHRHAVSPGGTGAAPPLPYFLSSHGPGSRPAPLS